VQAFFVDAAPESDPVWIKAFLNKQTKKYGKECGSRYEAGSKALTLSGVKLL
jgi:hypothetical protein